jgi:hypothetical protein
VLSDRERRELDEIERGLLSAGFRGARSFGGRTRDMIDPDVEIYAVLAVLSGVFATWFIARWPVFAAVLAVVAALNWRTAAPGGRPWRRFESDGRDADDGPGQPSG